MTRDVKLNHLGQAHLAPGMNLRRWQAILAQHNIGRTWSGVPDSIIDAIIAEITAIVTKGTTKNEPLRTE